MLHLILQNSKKPILNLDIQNGLYVSLIKYANVTRKFLVEMRSNQADRQQHFTIIYFPFWKILSVIHYPQIDLLGSSNIFLFSRIISNVILSTNRRFLIKYNILLQQTRRVDRFFFTKPFHYLLSIPQKTRFLYRGYRSI